MLVLHSEGVVDVVDVDLAFDQVLHTVPQQHLTTLVASPQHHAPATLSTGTRTIKVINFSVTTDLKSSLIVTFLAQTIHNVNLRGVRSALWPTFALGVQFISRLWR